MLAGWTGLEPAASGVTGRRSNQLNYHPKSIADLKIGDCRSIPLDNSNHQSEIVNLKLIGRYRIRTCDSRRVKPVLYH